MADKAEKSKKEEKKKEEAPAEAAAEGGAEGAAKGPGMMAMLTKTPVILGGVMLLEAVVLFAGFKFLVGSAPKPANAADLVQSAKTDEKGDPSTQEVKTSVEINLVDFKALNKLSGHSFLYDVRIDVSTKPEFEDRVTDGIKDHDALIKDRLRTIIAELDPEKLGGGSEPGLETLKRQVKYQLEQILGDGLVEDVLVPRCIPFRTDY